MSSTDPPLPPSPDEPTDEPQWGGGESSHDHEVGAVEPEGSAAGDSGGIEGPPPEEPTEVVPTTGDEVTEALPAAGEEVPEEPPAPGGEVSEVTEAAPMTGDDLTELLPPTGDELTEVMVGAGGVAATDGTGEWTREHRRRVSHRRYVMRRIGVGVVALAIVGGGIALLVALLGDDGEGADGADSTSPETSSAVLAPPETKESTTTAAPETTEPAATGTTAASATSEAAENSETTTAPEVTEGPSEETVAAESGSDSTTATESSPPGTVVYDLDSEASCEIAQTLRRGDAGPQVLCLQERLNEVTSGGEPLPEDGAFGERTEDAVRAFQAANDLGVDGVVGPATGELLGIWPA